MTVQNINVYDLDKYTFIEKESHKPMRDLSAKARLERMKTKFDKIGTLQSVECVMLFHSHSVIHVLVLQETSTGRYRLPGGKKGELEDDVSSLQRHLRKFLGKPDLCVAGAGDFFDWKSLPLIETLLPRADVPVSLPSDALGAEPVQENPASSTAFQLDDDVQTREEAERVKRDNSFLVVERLAQWTRPDFEMVLYPYTPPHISIPKERKHIYLMQIPPSFTFVVPKNYKVFALPLHELYGNAHRFGSAVLSGIPANLSRFSLAPK